MKPRSMKAVVKFALEPESTELRDMPVPETGAGDVLVRTAYIGVCGTDPHLHKGAIAALNIQAPIILGHEFSGVIEEVGRDVRGFAVGDRVTAETHADYCGACALCRTNRYHLCRGRKGYGFHVHGAFARYVCVPERILHRIPREVSLRAASLVEPLCVAYKALVSSSRVCIGDSVVVIGPGPIGVLCAKMAQLAGARHVVVIGTDGDESRLELARSLGATHTINSSKEEPIPTVMSLGDGYGADLVVDTAGSSATLAFSMAAVRPGGQITKIGWGPKPVGFSLDPIIAKSVTLRGHFSHTWDVWEKCLVLLASGLVELDPLITHELPIDQWAHAFDLVERKEAMKVVLTPID